jgi:hypothetical protein
VDFEDTAPSNTLSTPLSFGPPWDTTPWDTAQWGAGTSQAKNWYGAGGVGFAGTVYMQFQTTGATLQLQSIDYLYEIGQGTVL